MQTKINKRQQALRTLHQKIYIIQICIQFAIPGTPNKV